MEKSKKFFLLGAFMSSVLISTTAQAEEKNYESNTITQFIPGSGPMDPLYPLDPDPEKPVGPIDPTNPGGKPDPGTHGPLTIDYASSWDFGQQKISSKDEKYIAKKVTLQDGRKVNPYVQVSDFRGTNGGWTLLLKQDKQLHNEDLLHSELTGAEIEFDTNGSILGTSNIRRPGTDMGPLFLIPGGGNVRVMFAPEGAGAMTWILNMGRGNETGVSGVRLSIPGKTPKDAGEYRTTLTWTLADVPGEPEILPPLPSKK